MSFHEKNFNVTILIKSPNKPEMIFKLSNNTIFQYSRFLQYHFFCNHLKILKNNNYFKDNFHVKKNHCCQLTKTCENTLQCNIIQ